MAVESSVPTWRHRGQGKPLPVAPPTPPPPLPTTLLRNLTVLRPLPPRRLGFALRAGICMGLPIFVGWLAADVAAGMLAAIGGFTSLYGSGRPYASRAVHVAVVSLGFALAVGDRADRGGHRDGRDLAVHRAAGVTAGGLPVPAGLRRRQRDAAAVRPAAGRCAGTGCRQFRVAGTHGRCAVGAARAGNRGGGGGRSRAAGLHPGPGQQHRGQVAAAGGDGPARCLAGIGALPAHRVAPGQPAGTPAWTQSRTAPAVCRGDGAAWPRPGG